MVFVVISNFFRSLFLFLFLDFGKAAKRLVTSDLITIRQVEGPSTQGNCHWSWMFEQFPVHVKTTWGPLGILFYLFLFQGWWGFNSSGELPCESHVKNPWDPRIEILWEFGRNQRDGKIPLNLSKSRKIAAVDLVFAGFPKAAQGFFTCRRLWYEKQMKTMNHLVMTLYQLVATDFERIFPNKPFFGSSGAWAIILEHSLLKKTLIVYYI